MILISHTIHMLSSHYNTLTTKAKYLVSAHELTLSKYNIYKLMGCSHVSTRNYSRFIFGHIKLVNHIYAFDYFIYLLFK